MAVEIIPIKPTKKELSKFVDFGIEHYKGNPYFVPPLRQDDIDTLMPEKNPAFDFCEAQSFMAYRGGKPVGRITGIINNVVNQRTGDPTVRFGFIEFIDDDEVVDALMDTVENWGREKGMKTIVGPMGFTDMDHEGMLTFGFDEMGTMATIYNYPYYPVQMERRGMVPDAKWVEYRIDVPEEVPERIAKIADLVARRFKLSVSQIKSRKQLKERYGIPLFRLINEAYDKLYGYSPLTERQMKHYIDQYLGILNLNDICVIVDENDQLVGVGISVANFSKALRKSNGKLFPFGWWHLLRAMKGKNDTVDLLLVAIKAEYQGKGVNALLFSHLIPAYNRSGYKHAESNPELEDNNSVQNQWQHFPHRQHRRRQVYKKSLV